MQKFPPLVAAAAITLAALTGCDTVLLPTEGDLDGEQATMACLFDRDRDGFGAFIGVDAQGFEIDLRDYDPADLETCRGRHNAGEPLLWGRTDRLDPDDEDTCVGPSPTGWGTADLCPDNGADDDDTADDDTADDDASDDDASDDDDSTPDVPPVDNGEEDVVICWDADQAASWGGINALSLQDAEVGELYAFDHPTGWFDGNGLDLDADSGSRWCFWLQCGREHLINGEVNGSGIGSPNQQYVAHNAPNSSTPRLWGRFETEGGDQLPQELQDNGVNAGADVWVSAPDCD